MSAQDAGSTAVLTAPYASAARGRRSRAAWLMTGAGAVLLAALAGLGWSGRLPGFGAATSPDGLFLVRPMDLEITLTESGELKAANYREYRNEVEGASTLLYVIQESTRVKAGDLLIELASDAIIERLDTEEISLRSTRSAYEAAVQELEITRNENASKLKKAAIDLEVAALELQQYTKGEFEKQLLAAQIDITQAKMEIERKEDELMKNEELLKREFVPRSRVDQLKFELRKAEMTLERNELTLEILKKYDFEKNEIQKRSALEQAEQELERERQRAESRERQAEARVEEQKATLAIREARVRRLRQQLEKTRIVAESDGIVQYPDQEGRWGGDPIAVGQKSYEGQTLVIIPDTSQMIIRARIHEADRHQVREGLPVEVRVPAVPGEVFFGRISRIAQFADSANRWLNPNLKEHATEILLDRSNAPVSPGDSAEIKILVDHLPNVLAIPVQAVFVRGPKSYVFAHRGLSVELVEVQLGRSSTRMVEVTGGLKAGDKVYLHADESMLARLPAAPIGTTQPETLDMPRPEQQAQPGGSPGGRRPASRDGARPAAGRSTDVAASDTQADASTEETPAVADAAETESTEATAAEPAAEVSKPSPPQP